MIRAQRERVITARYREARDLQFLGSDQFLRDRPRGELARSQAWVGCGRPRCGLCHPHKRGGDGTRQRERRVWQRDWGV